MSRRPAETLRGIRPSEKCRRSWPLPASPSRNRGFARLPSAKASTLVLRPQVVSVLQFCKTSQWGVGKGLRGRGQYDLSRYQNWGIIQEWSCFYTTEITDEQ